MLLDSGADPSDAIHCAIAYEDEECLEILLDSGSRLVAETGSRTCNHQGFWADRRSVIEFALDRNEARRTFNPRIQSLLVAALVKDRRQLMDIATIPLLSSQLRELGWRNPQDRHEVIDSAALPVSKRLEAMQVLKPEHERLWPGQQNSVYHTYFMTADFAESLFLAGFTDVDAVGVNGKTPLLEHLHAFPWWRGELTLWFLEHGARKLVFPGCNDITFVHILAANLATFGKRDLGKWIPKILEKCSDILPVNLRDNCSCFCSGRGCSPVHALVKGVNHQWKSCWDPNPSPFWDRKKDLFQFWHASNANHMDSRVDFADICRLEIFERLGMRHTCCTFSGGSEFEPMDASEASEFEEEDHYLNDHLEALTHLYSQLSTEYVARFEQFWENWWIVLQQFLPAQTWQWDEARGRKVPRPSDECDEKKTDPDHLSKRKYDMEYILGEIRKHLPSSMVNSYPQDSYQIISGSESTRGRKSPPAGNDFTISNSQDSIVIVPRWPSL